MVHQERKVQSRGLRPSLVSRRSTIGPFYTVQPSTGGSASSSSGPVRVDGLEHVPRPAPGPNQVLLKVAAAGVCHSDTILLNDILDDTRTYLFGHENVGWAIE